MRANIYILGTSHSIQCGIPSLPVGHADSFTAEVKSLLEKYQIKCIAEEMSADGLEHQKVSETLSQSLAASLKIDYQAIDLSSKERAGLKLDDSTVLKAMRAVNISCNTSFQGVFSDLVDEVRERVWVARMLAKDSWPVLFICGANHAAAVEKLSRAVGLTAETMHVDYKP